MHVIFALVLWEATVYKENVGSDIYNIAYFLYVTNTNNNCYEKYVSETNHLTNNND